MIFIEIIAQLMKKVEEKDIKMMTAKMKMKMKIIPKKMKKRKSMPLKDLIKLKLSKSKNQITQKQII